MKHPQHVKNLRSGNERRTDTIVYNGEERRNSADRRELEEKLKRMLNSSQKKPGEPKNEFESSGSGNIIRRRKGQKSKRFS